MAAECKPVKSRPMVNLANIIQFRSEAGKLMFLPKPALIAPVKSQLLGITIEGPLERKEGGLHTTSMYPVFPAQWWPYGNL